MLMRHLNYLFAFLALLLLGPGKATAEVVDNYTFDFNSTISTSEHTFKPGTGWGHIVDKYSGGWSDTYVSYSYKTSGGVDDSGCLYVGSQSAGSYYSSTDLYDCLVTPKITGTASIMVKKSYSSASSAINFYKVTKDGATYTRGEEITVELPELSASEYTKVDIPAVEGEYIGIRAAYLYIDNFAAEKAEYELEPGLKVTAMSNQGSTEPDCDENNMFPIKFKTTIQNTGDMALNAGDNNYSLSVVNVTGSDTTVVFSQDITETIEKDATLDVELSGLADYNTYSKRSKYMVRENVTGTYASNVAWIEPVAYAPNMRVSYGSETVSNGDAFSYGMVNAPREKEFTISNRGAAVLNVTGLTLPDGFTCSVAAPFDVKAHADTIVKITLLSDVPGTYKGNVTITATAVDTLAFAISGTVIDSTKFYADFEDQKIPAGSYLEDSWEIKQIDYTSSENAYALCNGRQNEDNKFVTPKLSVEEGDSIVFDVFRANYATSGSGIYLNVYYSTDRRNWTLARKIEASELSATRKSYSYSYGTAKTFAVSNIPAGEYYLGFGAGYTGIDNVYGYKVVDVAHDLAITESVLPTKGMVNNEYKASVKLKNINAKAEAAGQYKAELYVAGEKVAEAIGETELLSGETTTLAMSYTPHEADSVAAYILVKSTADEYTVSSDTAQVNVLKEVAEQELTVGDAKGTAVTEVPYYLYNADNAAGADADIFYSSDMLKAYGLKAGQKISSVSFTGTPQSSKDYTNLNIYACVGAVADTAFAASTDETGMEKVELFNATAYSFKTTEPFTTTIQLSEPIVWDGEKGIRVFTHAQSDKYIKVSYESDATYKNAYYKRSSATEFTSNTFNPVATFGVAVDPLTISGKVTAADSIVAGAKVTATCGNVYYTATTAADGTYAMTIYQTDKKYKLTVTAEGYDDYAAEDSIELQADVVKDVEIVKTYHAVSGVVAYKSQPVAGAKVVLANAASEALEATTDESGAYKFDAVKHGQTYGLTITAEGFNDYTSEVVVADSDVVVDTVALTKPLVEVTGTVKCETAPVAGAKFTLTPYAEGMETLTGETDVDGKFTAMAEKDGKYMLDVEADGYEPFTLGKPITFTEDYDFGGIQLKKIIVDGINGVSSDALDENAPMFNTAGQMVDKNYRGIVIQNGKKFSRR